MKYGSVCSGIEAASVAWEPLGWQPQFFSEIEPFPSAVLAHHWPEVPNLGDMTKHKEWPDAAIDVLVGGTPCQSFSVAGLRKGMADPRGNLALTYLAIADQYRPRWLVWENVPGVLSSNNGRDFGAFLGGLGKLGYGFAYRVLDAQYFGVAQRRRRVFVVGCLGDWRSAAAVLFERDSLSGNPAPSREAGQGASGGFARSVALRGREGGGTAELGDDLQNCLRASSGGGDKPHVLAPVCFPILEVGTPLVPIAFPWQVGGSVSMPVDDDGSVGTLVKSQSYAVATPGSAVRRLTPVECERLQGFPDNFTKIPYRNKPEGKCPDGPRYKALGNSMAVPVMRWIGERITAVDAVKPDEEAA